MKPAKNSAPKSPKSTTATAKKSKGFTDEERAPMKERLQELKAEAGRGRRANKADGENAVLAAIAAMPQPDRAMGERLHAIIKANAPELSPKTWYGVPASAWDGMSSGSSKARRSLRQGTRRSASANLDEGNMWPTAFALKELTVVEETRIGALVKNAVN